TSALIPSRWTANRRHSGREIDPRHVAARELRVPDLTARGRGDAVRSAPSGCAEHAHRAGPGIEATVDAALTGEPEDAAPVECRRVQVCPAGRARERIALHLRGARIDADERDRAAVRHPRRT